MPTNCGPAEQQALRNALESINVDASGQQQVYIALQVQSRMHRLQVKSAAGWLIPHLQERNYRRNHSEHQFATFWSHGASATAVCDAQD